MMIDAETVIEWALVAGYVIEADDAWQMYVERKGV